MLTKNAPDVYFVFWVFFELKILTLCSEKNILFFKFFIFWEFPTYCKLEKIVELSLVETPFSEYIVLLKILVEFETGMLLIRIDINFNYLFI